MPKFLMDKQLRAVWFEFEGGSKMVLEKEELVQWVVLCAGYSDYLLPGDTDHVLAEALGGVVRGFVPPSALGSAKWNIWR